MDEGFEYFDHTADVGIRAYGKDLPSVFANAAKALTGVVCDVSKVRPNSARVIDVMSDDLDGLMVLWLNELLFYMDSENMIFSEFHVRVKRGWELHAVARGEKMDPSRHGLKGGIKAVTYHMLEVDEKKGYAQVLLDV